MAASLLPSAMVSMVSCLEFTIATTSIIKVFRASSFKLDLWVQSSDPNTALADLIWHSQIPPKWLPAGGFFLQVIQLLHKFCKNLLILFWSISRKPLQSSFFAPMKLLPLSDLSILTFPRRPISYLKHIIKESTSIEFTTLLLLWWG